MKNRMRELRTCGSVRGEGREVLTYSDRKLQGLDSPYAPWRELEPIKLTRRRVPHAGCLNTRGII